MHKARHLAAAASGGARPSAANSNSNKGSGDVTNRLSCAAMIEAISGKLIPVSERRNPWHT